MTRLQKIMRVVYGLVMAWLGCGFVMNLAGKGFPLDTMQTAALLVLLGLIFPLRHTIAFFIDRHQIKILENTYTI